MLFTETTTFVQMVQWTHQSICLSADVFYGQFYDENLRTQYHNVYF
jgi:hypothetical protein